MSKIDEIKKGDKISFSLVKAGIIGDDFIDVTVDSVNAGYDTARIVDPSLASKHANFYPYFKDKVDNVNDPNVYDYIIVKPFPNESKIIAIGIPWINDSTLKTSETRKAIITIPHFEEYKRNSIETFFNNLNVQYSFEVID